MISRTTPRDIRVEELERPADIERCDHESVIVDWEMLIELVTTPGEMSLNDWRSGVIVGVSLWIGK